MFRRTAELSSFSPVRIGSGQVAGSPDDRLQQTAHPKIGSCCAGLNRSPAQKKNRHQKVPDTVAPRAGRKEESCDLCDQFFT